MGGKVLSEEKRYFIKFMKNYLNFDEKEIKNHPSMINEDGSKIRLSTVRFWLQRISESGDIKALKKSGRPRKLDEMEEDRLIRTIKMYPKKRYSSIRRSGFLHVSRVTLNRYGLRNKYSKHTIKYYLSYFFLLKQLKQFKKLEVRKAIKRNKLSRTHIRKRLELCDSRLNRVDQKDHIFVDEKKFQASSSAKTEYCTRLVGEEFDDDKIQNIQTSSISSKADVNLLCYIGPFGKGKK